MVGPRRVDPRFAERFITSVEDFYAYGVDKLFNDWWACAPADAIEKYVAAVLDHPEQGPLMREGWLAPDFNLAELDGCLPGTLGHSYRAFMVDNDLVEDLAAGYRAYHQRLLADGRLARLPPELEYKVLRGFQTHDLHHVLTNFPATPYGELALQAFGLAQLDFPYAAMWIAVVTAHMAFLDPYLIKPAMDAITEGWNAGRAAKNIQFVKFEQMLDLQLEDVRAAYRLRREPGMNMITADERTPDLLRSAK